MVFVVKDIIVIFRNIKTILILISFKRYFSHPKNQYLTFLNSKETLQFRALDPILYIVVKMYCTLYRGCTCVNVFFS